MEGFLSLEQAAQELQFTVAELSQQIEEGRVVAIVREGSPWLSAGEVSRLRRQSERGGNSAPATPQHEELRLLRLSPQSTASQEVKPTLEVAPPEEVAQSTPAATDLAPPPLAQTAQPERSALQVLELNRRCAELEQRNQELESTLNRVKFGLQETEATLKRSRAARSNLENDVIALQDQLGKARTRSEALEREIQRLGSELERNEESHAMEMRRARSKDRHQEDRESPASGHSATPQSLEIDHLRGQMMEKDRLLAQEYEQRAGLRSQLEERQQKFYELKARYDKETTEWSELLAQQLQNQGQLKQQVEELKTKHPKGWNPFRRQGS